jgi:uncharacterized protein (DUF433 family)
MNAQGMADRCIRFDTHRLPQIHLHPLAAAAEAEDTAYLAFRDRVRGEFEVTGFLETLIADRVIRAAYRLSLVSQGGVDLMPSATERADEDCVFRGIQALEALRSRRGPAGWHPAASRVNSQQASRDEAHAAGELIALPIDLEVEDEEDSDLAVATRWSERPMAAQAADRSHPVGSTQEAWRDRLQFDSRYSQSSPVVRNTCVTAGHVVSLIIDGWSWADIMRSHPELEEDDIRACLAFTLEEEPEDFVIPPAAHAVADL